MSKIGHRLPFEWIAALRFLREGRTQSLLIVVGVGVGVAVIVFMSALLSGLQANLIKRTLSSQAHIVLLPPEEAARPQSANPATALNLQKQAQRLRSIDQWQPLRDRLAGWPEVAAVSPVASGPAFAVRGEATKAVTLLGIEPALYNRVIALAERLLAGELRVGAGEVVIGSELARDLGADGVHFSSSRLMALKERPDFARVAASCHTAEELAHVAALGLDFALLSPVLATPSHPEVLGMGWALFARQIEDLPLPVFALGGMTPRLLDMARAHGAHGIALLRGW